MDKTKKRAIRTGGSLELSERQKMIDEYLTGKYTKNELWYKYTGQHLEHGQIICWMRKLGYTSESLHVKGKKLDVNSEMENSSLEPIESTQTGTAEELNQRILILEKELEMSRLKQEGYLLMIEIAEQEFKIPIRKKSNTK